MQRTTDHYDASDFRSVFEDTRRMHDLARRFGSHDFALQALQIEAAVRNEIGDWDGTVELATRVRALAREQLNAEFEARSAHIIGETFVNRTPPDYERGVAWLQRALDALPPALMRVTIFKTNLGDALVQAGRPRDADPYLAPVLANAHAIDYAIKAYLFAEHLRRAEGRYDEAMAYARQGISEGTGDLYFVWELKADLGNMMIECGDVDGGAEELRDAIDLIETRRLLNTESAMLRASHFAGRQWVYASLLDVRVRQRRFDEAFALAERLKARALDDALRNDAPHRQLASVDQSEQRTLNDRIIDLNRKLIASKGASEPAVRRELQAARLDLETFNAELALRYSKTAAAPPLDPLVVPVMPKGGPVVEYALLPHSIVVFVVHDGKISARRLGTNREEIERVAHRFAIRLGRRDLLYAKDARLLYDALLQPVADLIPRRTPVTLVPDGFLWNVPFDALMSPAHRFIAQTHAINYAPSVTMLDAAERNHVPPRDDHELLAVGDPLLSTSTRGKAATYRDLSLGALPDAAREVRKLAELYGASRSVVLTHEAAREAMVKRLAPGYRVIHLATHGIVDDESPLYSALVLARAENDPEDGLLEMREVRELDLHADLIVLSSCDTARGTLYPGEGVVGLSWAFLLSGCPTTVVSQWKAESRSTSRLMIEFHRRLLAGATKAAALQGAKLALMRDPRYAHPFYWAPFIVVGDGTSGIRER
jgi:CHAT domain-containing protein